MMIMMMVIMILMMSRMIIMILAVMIIVIRDADKTVTYPQYSAVVSAPRPSCTHVGYLVPRIAN